MMLSEKGLSLIIKFEGFSGVAYKCPAGVWTIGYGHTAGVEPGDTCTKELARELLREDVRGAEHAVNALTKAPLAQGQFDALVSFTFNLGAGALKSSTLLKLINQQDYALAAREFGKWVNAGGKLQKGLVARRAAEAALFSGG